MFYIVKLTFGKSFSDFLLALTLTVRQVVLRILIAVLSKSIICGIIKTRRIVVITLRLKGDKSKEI